LILSWIGVLVVAFMRGGEAGVAAASRSNLGVLIGVLGIAGLVGWGTYAYNDASNGVDVEASVRQIAGTPVDCSLQGTMLLAFGNADVYGCDVEVGAPLVGATVGCYAVVDDAVYDVTDEVKAAARQGGVEFPCSRTD
jgi:hypothetical protein